MCFQKARAAHGSHVVSLEHDGVWSFTPVHCGTYYLDQCLLNRGALHMQTVVNLIVSTQNKSWKGWGGAGLSG